MAFLRAIHDTVTIFPECIIELGYAKEYVSELRNQTPSFSHIPIKKE